MTVDDKDLRRGFRNAWILTLLGALYVVAFFYLAWTRNTPPHPEAWDMGGKPFVPASSPYAEGYYVKPHAPPATGGPR
jgi:hypothetical protein